MNTSAGLSGRHPEIHFPYSDTHTTSGSSHDHLSTGSATLPWSSPAPSWASSRDQAHIGRSSSFGKDLGSPQAVKPPGSLLSQPLTIQDAGSGEVPPISVPALVFEGSMDVQAVMVSGDLWTADDDGNFGTVIWGRLTVMDPSGTVTESSTW